MIIVTNGQHRNVCSFSGGVLTMEVSLTRIPYLLYQSTWESHIFAFNNNVFRQDFSGESFVKHQDLKMLSHF